MKLSKDNWVKIASPIVLIVFGVLLIFTPLKDSVANAMNIILAVILIVIGAFYLALGFIKRINVVDPFSILGLGLIGLGAAALISEQNVFTSIINYVGLALGWAMFLFGCMAFIISIYHLAHKDKMHWLFTNFFIIELILAIICGVIGGLIVFPIENGIIPKSYLWIVHGSMFILFGLVWLFNAISQYKAERRANRKNVTASSSSSSSNSSSTKSTSTTKKTYKTVKTTKSSVKK